MRRRPPRSRRHSGWSAPSPLCRLRACSAEGRAHAACAPRRRGLIGHRRRWPSIVTGRLPGRGAYLCRESLRRPSGASLSGAGDPPGRRRARVALRLEGGSHRPRRIREPMTRKRVHEIAKEQGLSSKELLARLHAAGVEAKAAASSVEESARCRRSVATVRRGERRWSRKRRGNGRRRARPATQSTVDGAGVGEPRTAASRAESPPGARPAGHGRRGG